jgi:Protein of unknown function (DUF3140)
VAEDRQQVIADFDEVVNMTPKELEEWLETDESWSVGQKDDGRESTWHRSGRRIAEIQRKKKSDYTDGDLAHMRKGNGHVNRHLKQKPKDDVETPRWRYSLIYFSNATHP